MAGLLRNSGSSGDHGAKQFFVEGFPYENTAAKFWTCLFDEVAETYPPHTRIILSATCGGKLTADLLDPEKMLQRDIQQLETEDAQGALDDAMGVLELIGPPPGIRLRLVSEKEAEPLHDIALDDVDAELMPFLLAWMLEWARVPDVMWNRKSIRGQFDGEDRARHFGYSIVFELQTAFLSEDLYRRDIAIRFDRTRVQTPV